MSEWHAAQGEIPDLPILKNERTFKRFAVWAMNNPDAAAAQLGLTEFLNSNGVTLQQATTSPPSTMYVKGISPGETDLKLEYSDGVTDEDIVKATVIRVDLDAGIPEDDEMLQPGLFLEVGPQHLRKVTLTVEPPDIMSRLRVGSQLRFEATEPVWVFDKQGNRLPNYIAWTDDDWEKELYLHPYQPGSGHVSLQLYAMIGDASVRVHSDSILLNVGQLRLDRELWWFNGQTPNPQDFPTTTVLKADGFTGGPLAKGQFAWEAGQGKIELSSDSIHWASSERTCDVAQVHARSIGKSTQKEDMTVKLFFHPADSPRVLELSLKTHVRAPQTAVPTRWPMQPEPSTGIPQGADPVKYDLRWPIAPNGQGYISVYTMKVQDSVGDWVPGGLPFQEMFWGYTPLCPNNWPRKPTFVLLGAFVTEPAPKTKKAKNNVQFHLEAGEFGDQYGYNGFGTPKPVFPGYPGCDEGVLRVTQEYRIGAPPGGICFESQTLQFYRGMARQR